MLEHGERRRVRCPQCRGPMTAFLNYHKRRWDLSCWYMDEHNGIAINLDRWPEEERVIMHGGPLDRCGTKHSDGTICDAVVYEHKGIRYTTLSHEGYNQERRVRVGWVEIIDQQAWHNERIHANQEQTFIDFERQDETVCLLREAAKQLRSIVESPCYTHGGDIIGDCEALIEKIDTLVGVE